MFGGLFFALQNTAKEDIDLSDTEQLWGWQEDSQPDCGAYNGVFDVGAALQSLRLMPISRVPDDMPVIDNQQPEERDMRFIVHLYAHAQGLIDYADTDKNGDFVKLIDEFPERVEDIAAGAREGLHAAAIRAKLDGEGATALLSGHL